MRKACNLAPLPCTENKNRPTDVPGTATPGQPLATPSRVETDPAAAVFESVESRRIPPSLTAQGELLRGFHVALLKQCLNKGTDLLTEKGVSRITTQAWHGYSQKQRVERWDELVAAGFWVKLPDRGQLKKPFMPTVRLHRTLREVLRFVDSPAGVICHRETHRTQGVLDTYDSPVFVQNEAFYEEVVRVGGDSTRGKPTAEILELRKEYQRKLKSIQTHSGWFRGLKEGIRDAEPAMADLVSSQSGTTFVKDVFYKYKNYGTGRKYACSHGSQNSPRAVRRERLFFMVLKTGT